MFQRALFLSGLASTNNSEFDILLSKTKEEIEKNSNSALAEAVIKVREGKIKIQAGFDGVYGQPIFNEKLLKRQRALKSASKTSQKSITDFG